eukprot:GFKZ01010240.1.p2 GENE.GFKZ01010240.1~~GFKZ01010240.1.p2  ORF type:complete len:145 (-),score=13.19 GFKZ01010240.1:661-1095(-)
MVLLKRLPLALCLRHLLRPQRVQAPRIVLPFVTQENQALFPIPFHFVQNLIFSHKVGRNFHAALSKEDRRACNSASGFSRGGLAHDTAVPRLSGVENKSGNGRSSIPQGVERKDAHGDALEEPDKNVERENIVVKRRNWQSKAV